MTDATTGPIPPGGGEPPSRPPRPPMHPSQLPPRDGKPVSFYLAIFLTLLLVVSGGLNLLLLFYSAVGSAAGGWTGSYGEADDSMWKIVAVGGDVDQSNSLLRVPINGAIAEAATPVLGATGGTVSQIKRALRAAAKDDAIKGVLLDINSPGGGVTDSDEAWRLIKAFRAEHDKPVLAMFGDISASGGYYIAAACDGIMCLPTTITGSIGVIMQNFNVAEAAKTVGVEQETIISDSTPYKDILSMFRPMRPAEREILTSIVDELYERFVEVVDEGRPELTREQVRTLADGRVYSAKQAMAAGLVDDVGTIEDAYERLESMASIDGARVVEQRRQPGLSDLFFGARGPAAPSLEGAAASLLAGPSGPRFLYYWTGAR